MTYSNLRSAALNHKLADQVREQLEYNAISNIIKAVNDAASNGETSVQIECTASKCNDLTRKVRELLIPQGYTVDAFSTYLLIKWGNAKYD